MRTGDGPRRGEPVPERAYPTPGKLLWAVIFGVPVNFVRKAVDAGSRLRLRLTRRA